MARQCRVLLPAMVAVLLSILPTRLPAQPNPLDLAELQRLAALPEAQQRDSLNRIRITMWFLANCQDYMNTPRVSCIGRSNLVRMGPQAWRDQGPLLRNILAPPYGQGQFYLVFSDAAAAPGTLPTNWRFPRNPINIYHGVQDTCWEEMQHALLGQDRAFTQPLDMARWRPFLNYYDPNALVQEAQEHIFIDYAVNGATWMVGLNQFEIALRAAAEELKKYRAVPMTLAIEHHIFREAHNSWTAVWGRCVPRAPGVNRVDYLTPPMRAWYERVADTRLPTIDEVIAFYMTGGLTDDAMPERNRGNRILVPEWVMRTPRLLDLVSLQHEPDRPLAKLIPANAATGTPERLEHTFTIRAVDTYRAPGVGAGGDNPVLRGKLTFYVRMPLDLEREAGFSVKLNGKAYPVGKDREGRRAVVVDLPQAYLQAVGGSGSGYWPRFTAPVAPLKFEVTFYREKPSEFRGNRRYELAVNYKDADSTALGPAVYDESEAVFTIDLNGTGTSVSTGPPPSGPTGPQWVLVKKWTETMTVPPPRTSDFQDKSMGRVQESSSFVIHSASETGVSYTDKDYSSRERAPANGYRVLDSEIRRQYTWPVPPAAIAGGRPGWTGQVTRGTAGSYCRADPPQFAWDPVADVNHHTFTSGYFTHAPGASVRASAPTIVETQNKQAQIPVSFQFPVKPDPAQPVQTFFMAAWRFSTIVHAVYYQYEFRPGGGGAAPPQPPPATTPSSTLTRAPRPPLPPPPEDWDNKPPIIIEPPVIIDGLPPGPAYHWYTHPSGDWRVALSTKWQELPSTDELDRQVAPGDKWQLQVWRGFGSYAGSAEEALADKEQEARGKSKVMASKRAKLGPAEALQLQIQTATGGFSTIWFAHQGRLYRVYAHPGASAGSIGPGDECLKLLAGIQFLRGTGGTGPAPTIPSGDFVDASGKLTPAQATDVRHALNTLTLRYDLKLAVVFVGPMSPAEASQQAGVYRDRLIAAGTLPKVSGLLLYSTMDSKGYSRHPDFDKRVPLSVVKQGWDETAQVTDLPGRVAAQLRRIGELLPR